MSCASKALVAAFALTLALAAPASAGAAGPAGSASLVVKAGKWGLLKQRGVELEAVGASSNVGRRVRLQVGGGTIGSDTARIEFGGALKLSVGEGRERRVVRLGRLRANLGSASTLSAKLGKKRRVVFELAGGTLSTDPVKGSAKLHGARLVWRRGGRVAIESRLNESLPAGLGSFSLSVATVGGGDTPKSEPISNEPPQLARPATAVDVSGPALSWHVRDSWVRYVGSEVAEPIGGAAPRPAYPGNSHPCPDSPTSANPTLVYSYDVPFAHGWYDPPTGTAALYYSGGVRFAYPSRGIDLTLHNPEIEINGAASRAIFRLNGSGATAYPDSRAAIMSLDASKPLVQAPAGTFSSDGIVKAALNADGEKVFAGFYTGASAGFGCFGFSFTAG